MIYSEQLDNICYYFHFGLLVTGRGEEQNLPRLFTPLMKLGICSFEVIRKIEQLNPISSQNRQIKMVGSGQKILSKDEARIGKPARQYINSSPCHYVILVDDLESDRQSMAQEVFNRYRNILDTILKAHKNRASVHFLVNMLEAYYLADTPTLNQILGTSFEPFQGDVEAIGHPKGQIKQQYPQFNEIEDGGNILANLNLARILGDPETCAALRTLFAWCVIILEKYPYSEQLDLNAFSEHYYLKTGKHYPITASQLFDPPNRAS